MRKIMKSRENPPKLLKQLFNNYVSIMCKLFKYMNKLFYLSPETLPKIFQSPIRKVATKSEISYSESRRKLFDFTTKSFQFLTTKVAESALIFFIQKVAEKFSLSLRKVAAKVSNFSPRILKDKKLWKHSLYLNKVKIN